MNRDLKIVIDTNVLISSLWGGNPAKILNLWKNGKLIVAVNQQIINEYYEVLERFRPTEEDIENIAELIANPHKTDYVVTKRKIAAVKKDPSDNKFLEAAIEGKASFIVSGDKHLLDLAEFEGIKIITAKQFINIL